MPTLQRQYRYFFAATVFLLGGSARAQPRATVPPPDHGMVLATCMEVALGQFKDTTRRADTTNYVYRGRIISLDRDRTVSLCFDTEHMRVAGAWVGKPVTYTADKNMGPAVEGKMLFTTRPGPGWAKDGKWDDPRVGGEGPLPRNWAHYRGLYVNGDKVVLSYTVDDCSVLEMPGTAWDGDTPIITRTFEVGPSARAQQVLLCVEPWQRLVRGRAVPGLAGTGHGLTEIERAGDRLVIALVSDGQEASLGFVGGNRVFAHVPPHKTTITFRVVMESVLPGNKVGVFSPAFRAPSRIFAP